ncbi:MAG: hypothetical protein CSA35_00630 [Dethiosulfovibrio peptidovorans]|nr:MAG: hypothetical protein CSA35_00630 [Dethiosulfovibrio peptidovorans]
MKQQIIDDIVLFSQIISLALLLGEYIISGLYIGKELSARGWPHWSMLAGALLGAFLGGGHAALGVRNVLQKRKR